MVEGKVNKITWGERQRVACERLCDDKRVFDVMDRKIPKSPARHCTDVLPIIHVPSPLKPSRTAFSLRGVSPLYDAPTLVLLVSESFQ